MFCPSCRQEFRDGFTRCEDCSTGLVDALPIEEKEGKKKGLWVEVARFHNSTQADAFKCLLMLEEIECVIYDSAYSAIDPLLSIAIGGAKVMVFKEDYERALELYNKNHGNSP